MNKIINLTPHAVNIVDEHDVIITLQSEGEARCSQETTVVGNINGIPIASTNFGKVIGLPEEKEGVYYIVSRIVLSACKDRHDLLVPNELVRDEQGRIIGCRNLVNN